MAARNRVVKLGIRLSKFQEINTGGCNRLQSSRDSVNFYNSLSSNSSGHRLDYRQISQLVKPIGKRFYHVNTLALVRSLEAQGVPSKHAEAITYAMNEVLDGSLENISQNFISKTVMQKIEVRQEANLSKIKSEIQHSQEHHFALLQNEAQKLQHCIQKMHVELSYEIDKAIAGQRLDLNLQRGRIHELTNQFAETTNLTKLDQEIHELRAHLEAVKYEAIKYCIGTIVSLSVGIGMIQIFATKH